MILDQITALFGWMTLINLGIYTLTALCVVGAKDWIMRSHAAMFRIDRAALPRLYMDYLARYKLAFIVFNLVPYLALRFGVAAP